MKEKRLIAVIFFAAPIWPETVTLKNAPRTSGQRIGQIRRKSIVGRSAGEGNSFLSANFNGEASDPQALLSSLFAATKPRVSGHGLRAEQQIQNRWKIGQLRIL